MRARRGSGAKVNGAMRLFLKRNTPQLAAAGIKGIRIQLRDWICCLSPSSCGGATHAPSALLRGAPPPFDF